VATVHAQTRRTLVVAVFFGLAAVVAAVAPHRTGAWLPLHLFLVGAVVLAISGATRLFAVTWSAGTPVSARLVAAQRGAVAAGAAGLAFGRELNLPPGLLVAAGLSVIAGLVLLAGMLVCEVRSGRVRRFDPALRFYLAALAAGVGGAGLGAVMVTGRTAARDAHLVLNLLGLVGLVIAGTLPFFTATQARTKMSRRATARRLHTSLAWLGTSVVLTATAALVDWSGIMGAALLGYAAGLAHLATILPWPRRKQLTWAGPRLVQLGLGLTWWTAAVAVAGVRALTGLPAFPEWLVVLVVVGGYAQILVASLAYLGPVLRGGGHERLSAGFSSTRSWLAPVALNAAAVLWLAQLEHAAVAAVCIAALDVGRRSGRLVVARV
jgi:nitrite reductase (NO-forming)